MAIFGYMENHCKQEVVSRNEIESNYQLVKNYETKSMSSGTMYVVAKDNYEHRVSPKSSVTNCNITITAPDMYITSQHFESVVHIYTGSISPTLSVSLRVNTDDTSTDGGNININVSNGSLGRLVCVGNDLPQFLSSNAVYTVKLWFDGFCMCYSWSTHKYA